MLKRFIFLLVTIVTIVLGLIAPPLSIDIGSLSHPIIGHIPVPIFEPIIGLIFIYLIHTFYKGFRFGFSTSFLKTGWIIFPVLLTVLMNIITSKSLDALVHQLPTGQIFTAILFSFIGALIIGFFEETLFRGALFNFLMHAFKNSRFSFLIAAIVSSIIFGLTHLGNVFGGAPLMYTLNQGIYTTAMGFVFCMAYMKSQSLLLPILMHTVIDFSDFLFNFTGEASTDGTQWISVILTIAFIICGIGLYKTINTSINSLGFQE